MEQLDRYLLVGRPPRVVHLPTAAGLEGAERLEYWRNLARGHFTAIGVEVATLDVLDRSGAMQADMAEAVEGAGMIFLSGGDPHHLVDSLRDTPLWEAILREWADGAVLAGCSAGAMAIAEVIPAFRKAAGAGLGLLADISVIPHYDRFGRMMRPVLRMHDRHVTMVGIDENTALHGGPDRWTVYGPGSVHIARAHGTTTHRVGDTVTLP
jgi:cyanophycinase